MSPRVRGARGWVCLAACALLVSARARQEPPAPGPAAGAPAVAPENALERVVVMGASLSAGFGTSLSFGAVVGATRRGAGARVLDLGDPLFFTNPPRTGALQVEQALDEEPTLVIALDYLFWFGYGTIDKDQGPIELEFERLELLESGLAMLDPLDCPLVVGDFPDMSAAVGKMLSRAQMPASSTLPLLSKRVREWAERRGRTRVVPLSELVVRLGSPDEIRMGPLVYPPGSRLLQADQLHPTAEGLVALAQVVAHDLVDAGLVRAADLELDPAAVRARLGLRAPAVELAPTLPR